MSRMLRWATAAGVGLIVFTVVTGTVVAGNQEGETIVFELTLSGDVDADDSFGIYRQCETTPDCRFIHDQEPFCSSDDEINEAYGLERCEARTYRLTSERPAGSHLDYAIAFWDEDLGNELQLLVRDSVTLPEGGITLRLEYDYSRGSAPAAPPPALPDTAMASPTGTLPLGLGLVAAAVVLSRRFQWRG